MSLEKEEVLRVAELARLAVAGHELEGLAEQLGRILDYMEKLRELDTAGVPPTAHVLPLRNVWREDVVTPGLEREEALAGAPDREGPYFRVPRVVDLG